MKRPFAFPQSHKLKSRTVISNLFLSGESIFSYPIKCQYIFSPLLDSGVAFKASVSVPKKIFKKAVDRNRIKRQLREAIRLNQHFIPIKEGYVLQFIFIFIGKEIMESQQIDLAVRSIFSKLISHEP